MNDEEIIFKKLTEIANKHKDYLSKNNINLLDCVWVDLKYPVKVTVIDNIELPDFIIHDLLEHFRNY